MMMMMMMMTMTQVWQALLPLQDVAHLCSVQVQHQQHLRVPSLHLPSVEHHPSPVPDPSFSPRPRTSSAAITAVGVRRSLRATWRRRHVFGRSSTAGRRRLAARRPCPAFHRPPAALCRAPTPTCVRPSTTSWLPVAA